MFDITCRNDVVTVATMYGNEALNFAINNYKVPVSVCNIINDARQWAASSVVEITSFNDGNIEYSIDATFKAEKVLNEYITNLDDITIVRTGFGASTCTASDAVKHGVISQAQLRNVLHVIKKRNEAAIAFNF